MVSNAQFSVGTTRVLIATGVGRTRVSVAVVSGSSYHFFGNGSVTVGNGLLVPLSGAVPFVVKLGDGDELYAVHDTGDSSTVSVLLTN